MLICQVSDGVRKGVISLITRGLGSDGETAMSH